jgi:hypothetical protein
MAITVYATPADFAAVLPPSAWGARTIADVNQALIDASSIFDDTWRAYIPLPLARVGQGVARKCALYARFLFLGGRGYNPEGGADRLIVTEAMNVEAWLEKVQRRTLFPDVTSDPTAVAPDSLNPIPSWPVVTSFGSSVDINGRRDTTRHW